MSTQQPTPSFPNVRKQLSLEETEDIRKDLAEMHRILREAGLDPERIAVAAIAPNDMIIGQVPVDVSIQARNLPDEVHIFDPKRVTRLTLTNQKTGEVRSTLIFGEYDFMNGGEIVVKPIGFFMVAWLDLISQARYLDALINFFESVEEGAKRAAAERAGITIHGADDLSRIGRNPR